MDFLNYLDAFGPIIIEDFLLSCQSMCLLYFLLISAFVFLLYLPVCQSLILFSSICPSFWYCFWCAKFHTATCFCMIFCATMCHYNILIMYLPVIGCCLFLGAILGGTCRALFGHYLRAIRDSFKKSKHVKMSCYCIGAGYYLLLKFRFSLNFSLKFSISLVVISLLVSL